jgi:hypothetical protein
MLSFLVYFVLSTLPVHAQPAEVTDCPANQVIAGDVIASRFNTVSLGCVVQVTPRVKTNLLYREYWMDERGRLLVFTSVPGDNPDTASGTRTFFIFPRQQKPAFAVTEAGDLSLTLVTGEPAVFKGASARLQSFPGVFKEDSAINLDNHGGLEIKSFKGIILDAGWMVGSEAYKNPQGSSTLTDAHDQKCEIQNDEFFFYDNMYYSEPNLRFPDDESLSEFLKQRCPNLDVSALKHRAST